MPVETPVRGLLSASASAVVRLETDCGDPAQPEETKNFADGDHEGGECGNQRQRQCEIAQPAASREKVDDEIRDPDGHGERDKPAERGEQHARPSECRAASAGRRPATLRQFAPPSAPLGRSAERFGRGRFQPLIVKAEHLRLAAFPRRRSCELVSDQELDGAVQPDMRQHGRRAKALPTAAAGGRKRRNCTRWRGTALSPASSAAFVSAEDRLETARFLARHRNSRPSRRLAGKRRPGDAAQQPAALSLASTSRVARMAASAARLHRCAGKLRSVYGVLHQQPQDGLQPVVAGVMDVVRLGRGEQDAVDPLAENAGQPAIRAGAEAVQDRGERAAPDRRQRHAPPFIAPSTSTSTICRSSLAKWSRKNGCTTCVL